MPLENTTPLQAKRAALHEIIGSHVDDERCLVVLWSSGKYHRPGAGNMRTACGWKARHRVWPLCLDTDVMTPCATCWPTPTSRRNP